MKFEADVVVTNDDVAADAKDGFSSVSVEVCIIALSCVDAWAGGEFWARGKAWAGVEA